MPLRPYQQQAFDACMAWVRKILDPCLIEAPTGAGKSHIIAAIAHELHHISHGKKILCLAPSAELVLQNKAKYEATGNQASIFSASAGGCSLRYPVIFGTPLTVKNKIRRFGSEFCAVIVDEAHKITPTIKKIIDALKEKNPNLRVIGLSATPYRLGTGYIFGLDEHGNPMPEGSYKDPYFKARVYTIRAHELIDQGYLTPPVIGAIGQEHYDTKAMQLNKMGQFAKADVDRAYHGHGRKTSGIIADVVAQSQNRKGVLIFAATIQHAEECLASLPLELSEIVTGNTPKAERADILRRFLNQEIKYLVNVAVLTTGFDAPHVDVVALLRATESVALLQQIVGRGLRIADGKEDCLVLDYAENIDRHCPDGDIFDPEIKAWTQKESSGTIKARCPECGFINEFSARPNPDGFSVDVDGYFVGLDGEPIVNDELQKIPAHYGRRCRAPRIINGRVEQCQGRWSSKECPTCHHENDIAARYCEECKQELVDPNKKLVLDFKAMKKDPTQKQTDKIIDWNQQKTISKNGNECLRVHYRTPYRSFDVWLQPNATGWLRTKWLEYIDATGGLKHAPKSITYKKDASTGFYKVLAYNRRPDEIPAVA